jgi:hypothetical protein
MKPILFYCTVLLLTIGCNNQQEPTDALSEGTSGLSQYQKIIKNGPITFNDGQTTFEAYLSRTGEFLLTAEEMFCPATATLEFEEGHDIVLTLYEDPPCDRESILYGTLNPGGAVKLVAPDWWIDEVTLHTGCTLSGTFPVYHGHFDGQRLYATSHFHGLCTGGTMWGPWLGVSEEMGPIHVTFGIDLLVDE